MCVRAPASVSSARAHVRCMCGVARSGAVCHEQSPQLFEFPESDRASVLCAEMDAESIASRVAVLSKPSRMLLRDEADEVAKLCEIFKKVLFDRAMEFVKASGEAPLLYSYQSDGTPILAQKTIVASKADSRKIVRHAGRSAELLLQRGFLKVFDASGQPRVTCLFRDPLPLDHGKGTWPCFTAACNFFPLMRYIKPVGITISHYSFDRALFSSLTRAMHQRHSLYYHRLAGGEDSVGETAIAELCDWVVGTGCANHDAQNALKWALWELGEEATTTNLFIVIESLRNGYDLLHSHMPEFIMKHLSIVEERDESLPELWSCLGVEPAIAQELTELGLVWADGRLLVHRCAAGDPELVRRVSSALLGVFRFQRFTDSRWCSIGLSCRALVASLLLGLGRLVEIVRDDKRTSDYYIHGFAKLDQGALVYATVGGIVSHVADAFLVELLEDDRVAKRSDELEALLVEELEWVMGISFEVWGKLARLIPGYSSHLMRANCVRSAHIVQAFIFRRVLQKARGLPWSLARGDVAANLEVFRLQPEPQDVVSQKIHKLLAAGYQASSVAEGVRLLSEIQWCTTSVEQAHGSVAVVHRHHKQYGVDMLSARAMLHMTKQLLPGEFPQTAPEKRYDAQVGRLAKKNAQKMTGRHVFFGDFCRALKDQAIQAGTFFDQKAAMKKHAAAWQALSADARRDFELRAAVRSTLASQATMDEVQGLQALAALERKRLDEFAEVNGMLFRLAHCRLRPEELDEAARKWGDEAFTAARVKELRAKAMSAPLPPPNGAIEQLQQFDEGDESRREEQCPRWCAVVAKLRTCFANAIFEVTANGVVEYFAFLYATISPLCVVFVPLTKAPDVSFATRGCPGDVLAADDGWFAHRFIFTPGSFVTGDQVQYSPDIRISVIPHSSFHKGNVLVSHADPIPLLDLVASVPEAQRAQAARAAKPVVATLEENILSEFPWLQDWMATTSSSGPSRQSHHRGGGSGVKTQADVDPLSDEAIDQALEVVSQKREEWRATYKDPEVHFRTTFLGGKWTAKMKGIACDAAHACAKGKTVEQWCRSNGLPISASFYFKKYGDSVASALSAAWQAHMTYLYEKHLSAKSSTSSFSDEDLQSAPVPELALHFLKTAPPSHPGHARLREVRALAPASRIGAASSSSGP